MNTPEMINNRGQFIKVIEKRKVNSDLTPENLVFPKESWDAYLIPEEPDPAYYDIYEGN
jgi:hypothetical protein